MALNFPESYDAPESELQAFVEQVVNRQNSYRLRQLHLKAIAHWNYKGRQDIRATRHLTGNEAAGYRFERVETPGNVEPSIDNYIASYVDNETARLVRRRTEPRLDAPTRDEKLQQAARLAKAVLDWDLDEMDWSSMYREFVNDVVRVGCGFLVSYVDELQEEARRVSAGGRAAECGVCHLRMASIDIEGESATAALVAGIGQPTETGVEVTACPSCGGEIGPTEPTLDEVDGDDLDIFGSPWGVDVPRVKPAIEAVPWWELYPENGGRRVRAQDMRVWGRRVAREIQWVADRFPEAFDQSGTLQIEADQRIELLRGDPEMDYMIGNDWSLATSGLGAADSEMYPHHVVVTEVHVAPRTGLPQGISIYRLGQARQIIARRPYMVEVEGPDGKPVKVARAQIRAAQQKLDLKNIWGGSHVVDMLPLQWRLNRLDMQVEDIRIKGVPQVVLSPGDTIERRDDLTGSLNVYEANLSSPGSLQDRILNAQPLTGNAYMAERDRIVAALQRLGAHPLELGSGESQLTATEVSIRQAEIKQQREEVEGCIDEAVGDAWKHALAIRWAYQNHYDEIPDDALQKLADSGDQIAAFRGTDLQGQVDVEVRVVAGFDHTIAERGLADQLRQEGLYDLSTQEAREQYIDLMGAPKLDVGKSVQVQRAGDAWSTFLRDRSVAVLDDTVHDAGIWYEVLAAKWLSEEAREHQRRAGWPDVIRQIAGWEERLQQLAEQDAQLRQIYEGQPREQWPAIQAQLQQQAQQVAAAAAAAGQPVPAEEIPPPPTGDFLPQLLADRIMVVWSSMVSLPGTGPVTPAMKEQLDGQAKLMRFYALIQHARLSAQSQAAAQAPQPAPTQAQA